MGRIAIIVPVSVYEPIETLVKSANHLKNMDFGNYEARILYVFDGGEDDERVLALKSVGVEVLARRTDRGKRAGAINDGIEFFKKYKPDYIAIFDVDSRPSNDFILKCLKKIDKGVYIASAIREIINPYTIIAEGVFFEYKLIGFLIRISGFRQFNGLIGVLNPDYLFKYKLSEECITEDADFSTRMHLNGLKAELCGTVLYEQAPVRPKDLISQRKRWYFGGMELWKYFNEVVQSRNPKFAVSWIMALTLTYFPLLFLIPSAMLLPSLVVRYGYRGMRIYAGLISHILLLQFSSISAMIGFIRKRRVEWKAMERVE